MSLLAANVWHWWIAVLLVPGAVLAVVATVLGYLRKVESIKHPKNQR